MKRGGIEEEGKGKRREERGGIEEEGKGKRREERGERRRERGRSRERGKSRGRGRTSSENQIGMDGQSSTYIYYHPPHQLTQNVIGKYCRNTHVRT